MLHTLLFIVLQHVVGIQSMSLPVGIQSPPVCWLFSLDLQVDCPKIPCVWSTLKALVGQLTYTPSTPIQYKFRHETHMRQSHTLLLSVCEQEQICSTSFAFIPDVYCYLHAQTTNCIHIDYRNFKVCQKINNLLARKQNRYTKYMTLHKTVQV